MHPGFVRQGTYSIVACDQRSGEIRVAVQSHWFSVGAIVPWARAGVGAVATQANAEVAYGPRGLAAMADGEDPRAALARLVAADPAAPTRQVAMVDTRGRIAIHTGESCIPYAGHVTGDAVTCQANLMGSERVWPAMLEAYEGAQGALTQRLLAALDAAEAEGGDIRGRQSAAILVVPVAGHDWDVVVSLRVEDDPEPLAELRRLVGLHEAYALAGRADEAAGEGRYDEAAAFAREARELAPDNHELLFWAGLGVAQGGDLDTGERYVRRAIELQPGWAELLPRLPAEFAPSAAAVLARLRQR